MALTVFRLLSLLTQSLDSDQQQQQNQSSAQARAAMQKRGAAYYKRDRFLSTADGGQQHPQQHDPHSSLSSSTAPTPSPHKKSSRAPIANNVPKKIQEDFGLEEDIESEQQPSSSPNNNNNNNQNIASQLDDLDSDELVPISGPILQTSNASDEENGKVKDILGMGNNNNNDDDDADNDTISQVTVTTAQAELNTSLKGNHFDPQRAGNKGKRRK